MANDAARLLYSIGAQISQRLLDTSRKAGRLAFLDVTDRIYPHPARPVPRTRSA
jgi:CRP/FNR family cyclic AMP-dependent transcriptional regulator